MLDGIYENPTTVFFGKDMTSRVGQAVARYAQKVLLHFGGGSFKKYGQYDKVTASLKDSGVDYVELGGVTPNPRATLVHEGIRLCREHHIDFILAAGGGSVIDSAKAISIGVPYEGNFFDFFEGKGVPRAALTVGTLLTIPGSGSESSPAALITDPEKGVKLACSHSLMTPVFSILNPESTYTLSVYQTACGVIDAISHIFERYFTNTPYVDCSDRICEGLIKTLMKYGILVMDEPMNYDIRAEIMWACKLAHDNTAGFGRKQDWSSHGIAHEIGAVYDAPHAAIIGVVFPAWMQYVYKANPDRFAQFARRVFDQDTRSQDTEQAILLSIDRFKAFIKTIGMPTTLRELGIADKTRFSEISRNAVRYMKSGSIGNFTRLSPQDITNILDIAY